MTAVTSGPTQITGVECSLASWPYSKLATRMHNNCRVATHPIDHYTYLETIAQRGVEYCKHKHYCARVHDIPSTRMAAEFQLPFC